MKRLFLLLLLLSVSALALNGCKDATARVACDPEAVELLKQAVAASSKINYSGEVERVEQNPLSAEPDRVVFKSARDAEGRYRYEVLEPVERKGSFFVVAGGAPIFSKDFQTTWFRRKRKYRNFEFMIKNLDQLEKNYAIRFDGLDTVAGRATRVVDVQAAYPSLKRPSIRIWIDTETQRILGAERKAPTGEVTFKFAFRTIEINPTFEAHAFDPPAERKELNGRGGSKYNIERETLEGGIEQARKEFDFEVREPTFVPVGFELLKVRRLKTKHGEMCMLLYGDGLTGLSIKIHDVNKAPFPGSKKARKTQDSEKIHTKPFGFRTMYAQSFEKVRVLVTSELVEEEALRVLNSMGFSLE